MVIRDKRTVSEAEFYFADSAFGEYRLIGKTNKICPWCGGDFIFTDKRTAYSIECNRCEFKVTSRGF